MLIIALHMFAMTSAAPATFVTAHPIAFERAVAMEPCIPGLHDLNCVVATATMQVGRPRHGVPGLLCRFHHPATAVTTQSNDTNIQIAPMIAAMVNAIHTKARPLSGPTDDLAGFLVK